MKIYVHDVKNRCVNATMNVIIIMVITQVTHILVIQNPNSPFKNKARIIKKKTFSIKMKEELKHNKYMNNVGMGNSRNKLN